MRLFFVSACVGVLFTFKLGKHLPWRTLLSIRSHHLHVKGYQTSSRLSKQWDQTEESRRQISWLLPPHTPPTLPPPDGMTSDSSSQPPCKTLTTKDHAGADSQSDMRISVHRAANWGPMKKPTSSEETMNRQLRVPPANTNGVKEWPYRWNLRQSLWNPTGAFSSGAGTDEHEGL